MYMSLMEGSRPKFGQQDKFLVVRQYKRNLFVYNTGEFDERDNSRPKGHTGTNCQKYKKPEVQLVQMEVENLSGAQQTEKYLPEVSQVFRALTGLSFGLCSIKNEIISSILQNLPQNHQVKLF